MCNNRTCEALCLVSIDLKKWNFDKNTFRPKLLLFSRGRLRIFVYVIQKKQGRNFKLLCECASRPNRDRR